MNYYFDIETTGLNPEKDEIITIQFQELDDDFKAKGDLIILKTWKNIGEEEIVKQFYKIFMESSVWAFVPIGCNLIFDFSFIFSKFKKYNLAIPNFQEFIFKKPYIDIRPCLILANNGKFKDSGLDKMTNKKGSGSVVVDCYDAREYELIEAYIINETKAFLEVLQIIKADLIKSKDKWITK